jgi:site-specific DNA-methyltransferase (adenine-specific)
MSQKIVETNVPINDWFSKVTKNIDVYITDPPYPFDNQNGAGRFNYVDGEDYMYNRLTWEELGGVYKEMYDIANNGARAYVFCNRDGLCPTWGLLEDAGWTFRNIIVWDKDKMGMGYHWRNSVEFIVYVTKGKPKTYIKGAKNLFRYKKPGKSDAMPSIGYVPEGTSCKPYQIWRDILENGVVEGDVVADPFAGSNPLKAALSLDKGLKEKVELAYTNCFEI